MSAEVGEMEDLVYGRCLAYHGSAHEEVARCLAVHRYAQDIDMMENDPIIGDTSSFDYARSVLLVLSSSLVFVMQAGFAMICAGVVRRENLNNTMLKNLLDACGSGVAFFTVGWAFSFGGMDATSPQKTFVGTDNFCLTGQNVDLAVWLFQYAFSAATATIVAGTLADRCRMVGYLSFTLMLVGWVYPIVVHAVWNHQGFLSAHSVEPLWGSGMVDFAGSGVIHFTGGFTALLASIVAGPRIGRFYDETGEKLEVPHDLRAKSVELQTLGTFILWFGWYGFNAGSALLLGGTEAGEIAALAAVNSTIAASFGGIVALGGRLVYLERYTGEVIFDVQYMMNGSLSGLVAITAGCGVVEPWASAVIGSVAGCLYLLASPALAALCIDDAVEAIPVHMANGMWGVVAVGLLASPARLLAAYGRDEHAGLFYSSDAVLLGAQLVGILFIAAWVFFIMFPFFILLNRIGWFCLDPHLEELVGLDISQHEGLALRHDHNSQKNNKLNNTNCTQTLRSSDVDQTHNTDGLPVEDPVRNSH